MELRAKVDRIFFPKPGQEGDFYIIGTDKGTIKGVMAWRPTEKEALLLEGDYSLYQGRREFKFKSARADIPISSKDQLRYVCEITNGVGFAIESDIWDEWGEDWMEKVKPDVIRSFKGVKFDRFIASIDQFKTKRDEAEAISWLMSKSATVNMSQAAWERWGKEVIGVVKANCYRLSDLPNYGFNTVDQSIRYQFGINDTDPRRIKAAIEYAMKQVTDSGSTLVSWYVLKDAVTNVLRDVAAGFVVSAVREMLAEQVLVGFEMTKDICLQRDFENAMIISEYINK